ncbi:MAG: hypothetical protein ACR2IK_08240 [Chloroflexota bacterium]
MPRRGQHDQSPGDGRTPYSDQGGPAGRHAETHDVRREELTNPTGPVPDRVEEFAADIAPDTSAVESGGHADESRSAVDDKDLHARLAMLDEAELARLSVLEPGARLEQGGTYVDLNDRSRTPFKALGSQEAGADHRYVAKRDTDYELWNQLVGQAREADIERPTPADTRNS